MEELLCKFVEMDTNTFKPRTTSIVILGEVSGGSRTLMRVHWIQKLN